jgi:2-aminoadipate transaminase
MMPTSTRLSKRIANLQASPIREILAVLERPGMVSFAGGLPAAETFPDLPLGAVPASALQYGASEGDWALRARIAAEVTARGLPVDAARVLVLSGSQQGIDLAAKLFVDADTVVAVESPTYLAALQVLRFFGARFTSFTPESPEMLGAARPTLAYVNPTFQNPTGHCYDLAQRQALAMTCTRFGVALFEDDPYRELCFEDDCARRPICAELGDTSWIYQGSFSKSLAPGLRLGYLVCSPDLLPLLTRLKQAADLHSNRLSQALVLAALEDPQRPTRTAALIDFYRARRDVFDGLLWKHFDGLADWRTPAGGLFFWLQMHERALDTRHLLPAALARQVAFMPGEPFFADEGGGRGCLRLNFSHASPADAARGLATLAGVLREALAGR